MVLTAGPSQTPKEDKDEWCSPPATFRYMQHVLKRKFNHDAACTEANSLAPPLWKLAGFTDGDALSNVWPDGKLIWCNPPYSDVDPWLDRAFKCDSISVFLINSPNGEARYKDLRKYAHEIRIEGRLAFIGNDGKPKGGYTRGSSYFVINSYGIGGMSTVDREVVMRFG